MVEKLLTSAVWLLGLAGAWSILARIRPCNPGQPLARAGIHADLAYYFCIPIVFGAISIQLFSGVAQVIFQGDWAALEAHLQRGVFGLQSLPLWAQVALALLITDFIQYWTHRLFHTQALWRYHAIHHGPEHVDWLSSVRFHPVNIFVHSTSVTAFVVMLGFDPLVFAILAPFNLVYSTMVHANVDWDFGPLRWAFASPVFHRWHHSIDVEARDTNFAPTFPWIDMIFGTYYMPKGERPNAYGVAEDRVPETIVGQMLYPWRRGDAPAPAAQTV